jgi:hypothetical protein
MDFHWFAPFGLRSFDGRGAQQRGFIKLAGWIRPRHEL